MTILSDDAFVRFVQQSLIAKGFDPGPVDGMAGDKTQDALRSALGINEPGPKPEPSVWTGWALDARSEAKLAGVHPDLVKVVRKAVSISPVRFTVLEGRRSLERQKQMVAQGASQTMRSRHLTGHAVDLAPLDSHGAASWDWPLYHRLEPAMKQAAAEVGVPVEWGGDWTSFKDGPHWQLPWSAYP